MSNICGAAAEAPASREIFAHSGVSAGEGQMERGWVKLWRRIIDSPVFRSATPDLVKVWIWCLTKATHKGRWVTIKTGRSYQETWVEPGQFVFGRYSAADSLNGMSPSQVRNRIDKLSKLGQLDIKADRNHSVITICNWHIYQQDGDDAGQQTSPPSDHRRTTVGPPSDTNKKDKNEENKKNAQEYAREALDFATMPLKAGMDTPDVREACIEWIAFLRWKSAEDPTYHSPLDPGYYVSKMLGEFPGPAPFLEACSLALRKEYRNITTSMASPTSLRDAKRDADSHVAGPRGHY